MKAGCEGGSGGSEQKKNTASVGARGGQAWLGCSKKATWKKSKQSVKKVREGDSLLERTENGGKVG